MERLPSGGTRYILQKKLAASVTSAMHFIFKCIFSPLLNTSLLFEWYLSSDSITLCDSGLSFNIKFYRNIV